MATTRISNASTRSRLKQIFLLIVAIIIGVLISEAATAQHNFHKSKVVHHKLKYKVQVHKSSKICKILNKKRNYSAKSSFFATNRKPKNKPLAELDLQTKGKEVASLD